NRALLQLETRIRFNDDLHLTVPAGILLTGVFGFVVHYLWLTTKAAEHKVPVISILLAIGAHVPAHTGVDQRMRRDQAGFAVRRREGHILALQSQPIAAGLE